MSNGDFIIDKDGKLTDYCGSDTAVIIPEGVRSIDMYVFNYMKNLEDISIPDSIEKIDESNFEDCDNLHYNELSGARYLGNENNPYLVLVSADEDISLLDVKDGCKIIMGNALANNTELSGLTIPPSVRYIGFMAFYGCESLCELTLPEGVEYIDACAFCDVGIEKLSLPESLKVIDTDAFSTVSIKEVTLPSGIEHIGSGAFTHNDFKFNEYMGGYYIGSKNDPYICFMKPCDKDVTDIALHENTRLIYSSAFHQCKKLISVKLPMGLTEIGEDSFKECVALTSINIPESVTLIDEDAFSGCELLADVKLPSGKTEIKAGAFVGCRSIEQIELGEATVGDNAFSCCEKLKKFKAGNGSNLYGDYIFSDCALLEEVILPKSLEATFTKDELEDSKNAIIKYV